MYTHIVSDNIVSDHMLDLSPTVLIKTDYGYRSVGLIFVASFNLFMLQLAQDLQLRMSLDVPLLELVVLLGYGKSSMNGTFLAGSS